MEQEIHHQLLLHKEMTEDQVQFPMVLTLVVVAVEEQVQQDLLEHVQQVEMVEMEQLLQ